LSANASCWGEFTSHSSSKINEAELIIDPNASGDTSSTDAGEILCQQDESLKEESNAL